MIYYKLINISIDTPHLRKVIINKVNQHHYLPYLIMTN